MHVISVMIAVMWRDEGRREERDDVDFWVAMNTRHSL